LVLRSPGAASHNGAYVASRAAFGEKTVFVLGAGASAPYGVELADWAQRHAIAVSFESRKVSDTDVIFVLLARAG